MTRQRILNVPLNELRQRSSAKWLRYAPDVLPLWVAEMDTPVSPGAEIAIRDALARSDMGYSFGNSYAEAYADFAAECWGWVFDPAAQCRVSPDVLGGIRLLISLLTTPGQGVVINPPVYPPFFDMADVTGRKTVQVPLGHDDRLDLVALEEAFRRPDVTAHLLCSPHNPTSTIHSRAELAALAELADVYGVSVIADEIHAPFAGPEHVPYPSVAPRGFAVTSASKSWNLAALKGAVIIAGAESAPRLAELSKYETEYAVGHLATIAHAAALRTDRDWLDQIRDEVESNRQLLASLLAEHLPQVSCRTAAGAYLAWLDCRSLSLADPAGFFEEQAGVALSPGRDFGPDHAGFVRMTLATSPAILTDAVQRMSAAIIRSNG